uniref:Single-pass membrane protein with coiled-coil domains 3 n=1 Tax=Pelusios castaneus TaxID=367368 RepID=A0A8C8REP0_9SAUR
MSLSDIFFPDNPKRREEVVRLHQCLVDCMDSNFYITNRLIELLNTHLGCKITPIEMKKDGTIKENCEIFIYTMNKIQEVLQGIDEELKKKLEPSLYQKLHDVTESDTTKMSIIKSVAHLITGFAGSAALGIVVKLCLNKVASLTMSRLVTIMAKIGVSAIGLVVGIAAGLTIELILSAIIGAIERDQLEKAIQELEGHLKEFKPASKEYYETILTVILKVSDK